jgi:signal transduction histidine kinase
MTPHAPELLAPARGEILGAAVDELVPGLDKLRAPDGTWATTVGDQERVIRVHLGNDGSAELELSTVSLQSLGSGMFAVRLRSDEPQAETIVRLDEREPLTAEQMSAAYEDLRRNDLRLSRNLVKSVEAELSRASCEIHDGVAQAMSNAVQMLQALEAATDLSPSHRNHLARVRVLLRQGIADARMISRELMPASLARVGLAKTLKFELENLAMVGVVSTFDYRVTEDLDNDTETALYRIASEALLNVKKHAHARTVSLELSESDGWVKMSLSDDGVGFSGSATADHSQTGIGLVSMRARATLLGGSFHLKSSPGEGTLIEVRLPLAG